MEKQNKKVLWIKKIGYIVFYNLQRYINLHSMIKSNNHTDELNNDGKKEEKQTKVNEEKQNKK